MITAAALSSVRAEAASLDGTFSDVPGDHWAFTDIQTLRERNVTEGLGNNIFGLGRTLTRAEFVTFMAKLFSWDLESAAEEAGWYAPYVDAAAKQGAVTAGESQNFRPNDPITREEMAIVLIRSMGYDALAQQLNSLPPPFADVSENTGYIIMAKDIGVIAGMSADTFAPAATATREQAAAMLTRLSYKQDRLKAADSMVRRFNGFYAIHSAGQSHLLPLMDSVSFGWSRLELNGAAVTLNMTSANNNEYARPDGYEEVLSSIKAQNKKALLMIPLLGDPARLISEEPLRRAAVEQIGAALGEYDGVVIDFEGLRGAEAQSNFTRFLSELKASGAMQGKTLSVAVQPARQPGQAYFDGYDFKGIGNTADQVILMAHDYQPKSLTAEEMESGFNVTPLSPIHEVYYALQAITHSDTGVADKTKIRLQFSFDSAQWKSVDGRITNQTPYRPDYEAIRSRVAQGASERYSTKYESPFITFFSGEDGSENIIWYENQKSIEAKMKIAALFDVYDFSLWRIGLIPEEVLPLFHWPQN
jgi:hypothetical protein